MTRGSRRAGIDYGYQGPATSKEIVDNALASVASTITDKEHEGHLAALSALHREILTTGVDPLRDWPFPSYSSAALTAYMHFEADYQRIAEVQGTYRADYWRLVREIELWEVDPRNRKVSDGDPTFTVADVIRAAEEVRPPDGSRPTQEAVAEQLRITPRWVSKLCSPHGGYRAVVPSNRK